MFSKSEDVKTFPTCCVHLLTLSGFPRGKNGQQRHRRPEGLGALLSGGCMDSLCLWWMLVVLVLLRATLEKLSWSHTVTEVNAGSKYSGGPTRKCVKLNIFIFTLAMMHGGASAGFNVQAEECVKSIDRS